MNRHPASRSLLLAGLIAAALGLAACGGSGSAGPADAGGTGNGGQGDSTGSGGSGGTGGSTPPDGGGGDDGQGSVDTAPRSATSTNIAYERARPRRLWVVNPDNDSVAIIDSGSGARLAEVNVPAAPRTIAFSASGDAWVTSRETGALTVIDPVSFAIKRTVALPAASQPYGIVFSPTDGSAWVGLAATGEVARIDPTSGAVTARLDVGGGEPRHLAITADGARLLVSRFITAPLPAESTKTPTGTDAQGKEHGGELVVVDARTAAVTSRVTLEVSGGTDGAIFSRGVPNYLAGAAIAPDGLSAWVPSKKDNVQRGKYRDSFAIDFQSTVRAIASKVLLGPLPVEDALHRLDLDNTSQASAAAFEPSGRYVYVALETSREFAIIDAVEGRELRRIHAGAAAGLGSGPVMSYTPQGIAISADGKQLAVNNVMSRAVALFDLGAIANLATDGFPDPVMVTTVTREKLTPQVLLGKQLFHDAFDPRLSQDRYMSCASCHNEGGEDGRVWDLTQLGNGDGNPASGEGLRNTISLIGRSAGSLPLHWSANFDEIQDFEGQIRSLAGGRGLLADEYFNNPAYHDPLAGKKAGLSAELDALAAYVASLSRHAPSPLRNADRSLTASAAAGRALFASQGCASCHGGDQFAGDGTARHDIGTLSETTRPASLTPGSLVPPLTGIDTPTLRDVWATAPYLHDGSALTVEDAIRRHTINVPTVVTDEVELKQLADYVRQIGSEEPAPPSTTP